MDFLTISRINGTYTKTIPGLYKTIFFRISRKYCRKEAYLLFYINNLWFESRDTGPMKDNYYLEAKLVSREASMALNISGGATNDATNIEHRNQAQTRLFQIVGE